MKILPARFARNSLVLAALLLGTSTTVHATDVTYYFVAKGMQFRQTSAAPPAPKGNPARFDAQVGLSAANSATNASVQLLPSGTVNTLTLGVGGRPGVLDTFSFQGKFASQSALDAAYPNGSYKVTIGSVHDGTKTSTLTLSGNAYPASVPYITNPYDTNFNAVVITNSAAAFTLTWAAFTGGTANDFIQVGLADTAGNVLQTPNPGQPGALNGTATSLVIPANTFSSGQQVSGTLVFAKAVQVDTTSYPGVPGFASYYTSTDFGAVTLATVHAADVTYYFVSKGMAFRQTSAAPPAPKGNPARFDAQVGLSVANSATNASVQFLPSGMVNALTLGVGGRPGVLDTFHFQGKFASQSALDAADPNGSYKVTIGAVHDGTKTPTLTLNGNAYPASVPYITNPYDTNFNAVVITNSAAAFTLTWAAFTGGTANDFIQVGLADTAGNVLQTPNPGQPGALNGTATSLVIPANTFSSGQQVFGTLVFAKAVQVDTNSYPGVPGFASYYTSTDFGALALAQDVAVYNITKQQFFDQTSAGPPVLSTGRPFRFGANVAANASNSVTAAQLSLPSPPGGILTLNPDPTGTLLSAGQRFTTQALLDAGYPAGPYTLRISAMHDGTHSLTLSMPPDTFPPAPHVANWAATQNVNPAADFSLTWDPYTGPGPFDFILVSAADTNGNPVASMFLPSAATNFVFAAGTFQSGRPYGVDVQFRRFTTVDTNAYPGATGLVRFFSTTSFTLMTSGGAATAPLLGVVTTSLNPFQLQLTGQAGARYAIDASTNLQSGFWIPLVTNTAVNGQFTFTDPQSANFPVRFYRGRVAN